MRRKYWLPASLPAQLVMFTNIKGKIGDYTTVLPLTAAQEARIVLICQIFVAAYEYVEQARATVQGLVDWRDNIFKGTPAGAPAPAAPSFATLTMPAGSFVGIITEMKELRELIVALPGYTTAIGEDLMILGEETEQPEETEVTPELKVSTSTGYKVTVKGSMKGMDAIRIDYQRSGTTAWPTVAFFTNLPNELTITPAGEGPESGRIRGIFIRRSEEFGNFSPEYPVTVS